MFSESSSETQRPLCNTYTSILNNKYAFRWMVKFMTETTTIRVTKKTAETLESLRQKLGAASLDETIQSLVKKQRKAILEQSFGVDKGRIKPFTESDRGEDRS